MDITDTLRQAAFKTVNSLGDLARPLTYHHIFEQAYDPQTGHSAESIQDVTIRAMVDRYAQDEVDGLRVLNTDRRIMLAALALGDLIPRVGDRVTLDGRRMQVLDISADAAEATYTLHVRDI